MVIIHGYVVLQMREDIHAISGKMFRLEAIQGIPGRLEGMN